MTAGPHTLGVTFLKNPSSLLETKRQPYQAHYNMHRHPRISPALYQVSITGPYARRRARRHAQPPPDLRPRAEGTGRGGSMCQAQSSPRSCARAYRRPVADADLRKPMELYRQARAEGDFDAGIEMALSAVLVNPQFLFRIEAGPARRRAAIRPIASRTSSSPRACRSSSGAASRTTSCSTWPSAANCSKPEVLERQVAPHAGRPAFAKPGDQLRGPVAAPAEPGFDHPGPAPLPRLRRQPAAGLPPGDGTPVRERPPRGSQRARPAEVGLHLPERAPGQALRHPERLRQPLPPRRSSARTACGAACSARGAS